MVIAMTGVILGFSTGEFVPDGVALIVGFALLLEVDVDVAIVLMTVGTAAVTVSS